MARPARTITKLIVLAVSLAVAALDVTRRQVRRLLNRTAGPTGVVLYYHSVAPQQRRRFANQMDELLKRASPFPADSPEAMTIDRHNVAVTFDDGFESVLLNAIPELEKRSIPFTLFVASGCLGGRPLWAQSPNHRFREERVLSTSELRAIASLPTVTLGSHSVTHRNLSMLNNQEAEEELVGSRSDLQATLRTDVHIFSFPYGAYSPALLDMARKAGYRRVFTIEPSTVHAAFDSFAVGRVAADPDDWLLEFRLKIAGAYRWRHCIHRLRHAV